MASLAEVISNAQVGWRKLNINQKMVILITIALFSVMLGFLIYWISRPSYAVLFSNLSSEDASAIVAKLQEKKIPYRLSGMQTIEVPSNQVYETRIELAGEGLPQGGTVGYEIFNQNNFGLSEFAQKVNYRRALEGELVRTISQINEISGARVHIVIPEPSLYTEKENPTTASVIIKPKAGAKISEGQVQGIVNLVARSVEGLKPENITVVDTNGNVLNEVLGDQASGGQGIYTKSQLEAKKAYESSVEESIESMLGAVMGSKNNAVVRVSADLDFTQRDIQKDTVEQGDNPVVVSEQEEKEKYEGPGSPPGGVPGISSQTASSTAGTTTYVQAGQGETNKYSRTNKTVNYEVTKIRESIKESPGKLKRLSVAVVVNNDGSKPIRNATIEKMVAAAAGIDKKRGDILTVSSVPFDTEWMKKEEKEIADAQRREMYITYAKYALVAILIIAGLFILLRIISSLKPRVSSEEFIAQPISKIEAEAGGLEAIAASDLPPEKRREMAIQKRKSQLTREELQNLARERPGDVAQLLRIWLNT
ncbi:MAG: flagellar basal-body MS-ring/collar protein FliF [Actinomycetota bacterium]|nr:flagellar basal-body MS-ring/collar protein FliF [Actinomycetota bacterium]